MRKFFYLNVNGFYGTREKARGKFKAGLDDNCCVENAEGICKQIMDDRHSKYDVIFFSEFAPNTPSGKWVSNYLDQKGYKLVLPNAYDYVENGYYSIVVAYVRKDLKIEKSKASPKDWLTWCELSIDDKNIVGIHATNIAFLNDIKETVKGRIYKEKALLVLGDTNVTEKSEENRKVLMSEIM